MFLLTRFIQVRQNIHITVTYIVFSKIYVIHLCYPTSKTVLLQWSIFLFKGIHQTAMP